MEAIRKAFGGIQARSAINGTGDKYISIEAMAELIGMHQTASAVYSRSQHPPTDVREGSRRIGIRQGGFE